MSWDSMEYSPLQIVEDTQWEYYEKQQTGTAGNHGVVLYRLRTARVS